MCTCMNIGLKIQHFETQVTKWLCGIHGSSIQCKQMEESDGVKEFKLLKA